MEDWIAELGAFVERNRFWAAPVLGLTTFGESLVLIGAFFPATALMVIAGGLIGAGVLHPVPVLLWCIGGAAAGDAISYLLGRRLGPRAWRHPLLKPRRRALARARLFFRRYGTASIYLCRFMGPVRAFVPLIAGMTGMAGTRFQLANVGSAVVWVPVMLAPGYLAAKGVASFGEESLHTVGVVVIAAVAATVVTALVWRRVRSRLAAPEA